LPGDLSGNPRMSRLADCYNPMRLKAVLDDHSSTCLAPNPEEGSSLIAVYERTCKRRFRF
jgi:hypothetical protein